MKKLIIIGAGSVGGFIAYNHTHLQDEYELIGFLDDDVTKVGKSVFSYPVLGTTDDIDRFRDCSFILGIAFPKIKQLIVSKLREYSVDYISYISPNAWISNGVKIGEGVIIYPGTCINYETTLGDFVTINMNTVIGHNCTLQDFTTLAPGVCLAGYTYCNKGVEIGINAATRQKTILESFSVVGGQAMVLDHVQSNKTVAGVPAKEIK